MSTTSRQQQYAKRGRSPRPCRTHSFRARADTAPAPPPHTGQLDADSSRRRRENEGVQLRKNKREEGLAKRRNLTHINNFTAEGSTTNPEAPKPAASNPKYTVDDIPALTAGLHAADVKLVGESLKGFRRLLSIEPDPPVVEVMNAGVLPTFVALLQRCVGDTPCRRSSARCDLSVSREPPRAGTITRSCSSRQRGRSPTSRRPKKRGRWSKWAPCRT